GVLCGSARGASSRQRHSAFHSQGVPHSRKVEVCIDGLKSDESASPIAGSLEADGPKDRLDRAPLARVLADVSAGSSIRADHRLYGPCLPAKGDVTLQQPPMQLRPVIKQPALDLRFRQVHPVSLNLQ